MYFELLTNDSLIYIYSSWVYLIQSLVKDDFQGQVDDLIDLRIYWFAILFVWKYIRHFLWKKSFSLANLLFLNSYKIRKAQKFFSRLQSIDSYHLAMKQLRWLWWLDLYPYDWVCFLNFKQKKKSLHSTYYS